MRTATLFRRSLIFSIQVFGIAFSLLLAGTGVAWGAGAQTVPKAYLEAIVDDEPNPLPRNFARYERPVKGIDALPLGGTPPASVRTPPEYADNRGLIIRWGSFNDVLTAMTVAITTGDPDAMVHVLVNSVSQQNSARGVLAGAGAEMDQVDLILYSANSVWMRDYGPRFVEDGDDAVIVDHTYNRPRPLDNAFPDFLAPRWNLADYDIPLVHGGGNFHLFGNGEAFMTDLILRENPGLSEQDVKDHFRDYEQLDVTLWPSFPSSFDSTQHIDMWMLPVRDGVAMVGEYDISTGAPHTVSEAAVVDLEGRGYTVFRVRGWNASGTHYTYTNSVIFNDLVLVPEYSAYPQENADAVAIYEAAFPNHQIVPVDASVLVTFAGVLHCIVMHVPQMSLLFGDGFESGDFTAWSAASS